MSLFDLSGKVAIVTGSSRGIGRASAERLAEAGASVVISSRKEGPCREVAEAIVAKGGRAIAVPANISSGEELTNLVRETRERLGPIDILVCNAASNPYYGPMGGITDEQFRKIFDNNVLSAHKLIHLCAPDMAAKGGGAVVIVSSITGLYGSTSIGAYGISKAADMQLARNLAVEFGPQNIRVNCVAPGLVRTDFARALWDNPDNLRRVENGTPLRRIGDPDDIAGVVQFLASQAGAFVTGQTVVADGGRLITGGAEG
ncbi:SDR family NAD(P)-dependent oxidoreductase [Aureimonas mangrovi]|uniref:SDR family NAD(P)-dependent oxidoreductase n=1 Tax=Aureimonas mangrovi TaxID=2758041 RepID=UPI00163D4D1A|nr:SDR family oxidoreductase [Aureimonas mangrovi]